MSDEVKGPAVSNVPGFVELADTLEEAASEMAAADGVEPVRERGPVPERTGTILDYAGDSEWIRAQGDPGHKGYKDGRPSDHERGVQWIGPWEEPRDGFNEHTRRSVRALASSGLPVQLRGLKPRLDSDEEMVEAVREVLEASISRYEVRVVQMVPSVDSVARFLSHSKLTPEEAAGRSKATIIYSVWERDGIDADLVRLMSRAGALWVATRRNAKALIIAGADPAKVSVVPLPFEPTDRLPLLADRPRPAGPPRFLHIGKWEPRKAQATLVEAFMLAFRPGDAELIIKTSKSNPKFANYPSGPVQAVANALKNQSVRANGWTEENTGKWLRMIRDHLTQKQINALHAWADNYVTVSHGEGWDMPAFDSALAGNRLVYTPSGGPDEYACEHDVIVENCALEPADPFYDWEDGAAWTSVAIPDVVSALRVASTLPRGRVSRDMSRFSSENVGKQMRSLIESHAASFGVSFQVSK